MAVVYDGDDEHERHLAQRALRRLMALLLGAQAINWPMVVLVCVPSMAILGFIAYMAWLDDH